MASEKSATSEWIQFFKEAGIPPSLAINYAVSFVDNRIQKNMLMDLSKDIMMDLGITVIGDIIAILKHAKLVYRQDMCKMATEAISSGQTSIQAELRRTANTPSSEPAAEGGNGLLVKRRRVTAEMEGKYIINMPKGTTPRTRRILGQQTKKEKGLKRTSVFARLGAESKADTTSTVAAKVSKPSGVFSRLGGGQEDPGWQRDAPKPTAAAAEEEADSDGEGSVLQYAGVLKRSHPSTKKEPAAIKPVVIKPASFALSRLGKKVKMPSIEPPPPLPSSTSSTHEGGPKRSILQRLGKAPNSGSISLSASATPLLSDALPLASPKVSSSTSAAGSADCPNAQMDAEVVSVFKRLGSKKT
ncbi:uncharacterized protein C19orf47 homolog isoform X3 [Clupea harengus]|uniref:Uncharacterized protein C19orf47 homolog isoform X3 n=1 Tax=Clupea harengus TaxID=7950 RepID=A0A6P8FZG0_CLUHA|nr:uncharacterized protein C19orf47 homolog isoform X3 [Clupea harengus]